jgi:S1-C subfamily serine protease
MTTRVACPHCRATNEVPDDLLGKKIRCRRCDGFIVADMGSDEMSERPQRHRRRPGAEDDEPRPTRRPRRRRRPKGQLSPVAIITATFALLVVLIGGLIGAYFISARGRPTQPEGPPQPPVDPRVPLMEMSFLTARLPQYDPYFLAPKEPPGHALEFTEPAPQGDGGPQLVRNPTGQLTPEVLQRVKQSTVFVGVKAPAGQASGSGFLAGESGFVVTNAHVVFMLQRGAPPPTSVKVVRNKGEKNEVTLAARVAAVDHDADLAVLSIPKEGLPPPLTVKSALSLRETQPVYVAGFPLGEAPGRNVSIDKYDVSSLKKDKGVLDKVQIHGDMVPGNSGGPVLDADGNVVAVCVSILTHPGVDTRINFAVPGDKVLRLLNGHLAGLTVEPPALADDGRLRLPVAVHAIDPLGRVLQVAVDFWSGPPGQARPGSLAAPKPLADDGPHQTLSVALKEQAGRGELTLPPLAAGQVYWLQPSLVRRGGARVWLSAQAYRPPPPVARKPARLAWAPAGERPLVLERWSSLYFTDQMGSDRQALLALETRLTESVKGRQEADVALHRQVTGFKEGVSIGGQVYMTTRLQHVGPNTQFVADNVVTDAQGQTIRAEFDPEKMRNAPALEKSQLIGFQRDTAKCLQALEVPLPGNEVEPGKTWKAQRPLPFDATWTRLDALQSHMWGGVDNEFLDVTYTYRGRRTVNGAERAVIELRGQLVVQRPGAGSSDVDISGTADVDLATGQVVQEEVTTEARADLIVFNTAAIKAHGTVVTRLRRE